ncbi:MAG: elongation factor P maturation arginine rhamnosyltransferase EarP, partial [Betaproteobacteria bacterium]|nr:elongation factor P maturation arginine rhamnosyltransferase EarP [Betaproteobacteria bacterium]
MNQRDTWDLFCHVVDNFGDIGVGWRLARQLAHEHGRNVRLFVDDLNTFRVICPQINPRLAQQSVDGVQVFNWGRQLQLEPGDVVVELFGCKLVPAFLERVQQRG